MDEAKQAAPKTHYLGKVNFQLSPSASINRPAKTEEKKPAAEPTEKNSNV